MIFLDFSIPDLFNKIMYYVDNQDELNNMLINAQSKIIKNEFTWEKSTKQFNNLLF